MLQEREVSAAIGTTAYDADGHKLGVVEHFYLDDRTGEPTWVSLMTGLLGTRQSVVPAVDASFADGRLTLPVAAEQVRTAPALAGEHLSPEDEDALRRHYAGGTERPGTEQSGTEQSGTEAPVVADGSMVRSEEHLVAGTERVPTQRARLVKYVVTEEVQITVPVRREEIRVEYVPLDAPDDAGDVGESLTGESPAGAPAAGVGSVGTGLPEEIVLHTERPVVTVEVVPTERVRLRTEVVHGQQEVSGQVQREQIVVDQDTARDA